MLIVVVTLVGDILDHWHYYMVRIQGMVEMGIPSGWGRYGDNEYGIIDHSGRI